VLGIVGSTRATGSAVGSAIACVARRCDLNRGLPLVTWFLAIPHDIVRAFLSTGTLMAIAIAWFTILSTGR